MSPADLNNLKNNYINSFESYLDERINTVRSDNNPPVNPDYYCRTLPPPGCYGITPEPKNNDIDIPLNNTN
jgi:hypothetical protein